MSKAKKSIIAMGMYFAVANVALKFIGNLLDGDAIQINRSVTWTALFWFVGGLFIGYLNQKSQSK
nr:hypothetical protein [uncultured bacterium]